MKSCIFSKNIAFSIGHSKDSVVIDAVASSMPSFWIFDPIEFHFLFDKFPGSLFGEKSRNLLFELENIE